MIYDFTEFNLRDTFLKNKHELYPTKLITGSTLKHASLENISK